MKVLQIGLSYNPGGIESCIMDYFRRLSKLNVSFDFICMYDSLAYEEEIKVLGGRIFYLPNIKKHPIKFKKQFYALLMREKYDVVHVNMLSAANIVPLTVAKKAGIRKIIAHSHNSSSPGVLRNILHVLNKRSVSQYATHCAACSKLAAQWLFSGEIYKNDRYILLNNAINVQKYLFDQQERNEMRSMLEIENKWVIGHVGRFEEQKNHESLIDIFSCICKRSDDAVLLLVGTGELKDRIEKKVMDLGLGDKVKFLGVRKDVDKLWKAMDIFLFPSLFEGLPIVAIEAQASGILSFFSDTITRELKITDQVEFLPLSRGAEYWCEKIIERRDYRREEADNQKIYEKFAQAGYTIETAGERLLELYEEEMVINGEER